jgi:membrane protease YdiL (CAAX protease family)
MNSAETTEGFASPRPAHWGFCGTVIWGVVIGIIFLIVQSVIVALVAYLSTEHVSRADFEQMFESAAHNGHFLSFATFATAAVGCGAIAGVIKLKRGSLLTEYLGLELAPARTMLKWIGLAALFVVLSDSLTLLLGRRLVPEFMSSVYATANPAWMIWLALVVAAPLFEETFFRGFLFKGFESSFLGPTGAVLVTAGLWAMMHSQYNSYEMATIFCLGLLLGGARRATGTLSVPVALHAAVNFVATIETALFA